MIKAMLGSSVIAGLLTALFTLFDKRKHNSINYITEERKVWREKIRTLSEHIQGCKFEGRGKRAIRQYLVQLQMNINTYGKIMETDYHQDGHIWRTIEQIKTSQNEEEFNEYKELLLFYISLMLKEDWERSKDEIKGYSNVLIFNLLSASFIVLVGFYYFYLCGLRDIIPFVTLIVLGIVIPIGIYKCAGDKMKLIMSKKRLKSKKKLQKELVKLTVIATIAYILIFASVFGATYQLKESITNDCLSKMKYRVGKNDTRLYIGSNSYIFQDADIWLAPKLDNATVITKTVWWFTNYKRLDGEYESKIRRVVENKLKSYNAYIFGLNIAFWTAIVLISVTRLWKKSNYKWLVNDARYIYAREYEKRIKEVLKIARESLLLCANNPRSQACGHLLEVENNLLIEIRDHLSKEIRNNSEYICDFAHYQSLQHDKHDLVAVEHCIQEMEKRNDHTDRAALCGEVKDAMEVIIRERGWSID